MIRVLQVLPCLQRGGTEAFVMNHFRAIDRTRFQFDFLVFQEKETAYLSEIKQLGGNIYFCGQPGGKHLLRFIFRTIKCIKKYGPYDALHVHADVANSWVLLVAKLCGVKTCVSHSHSSFDKYREKGFRFLYRKIQKKIINKCSSVKLACSYEAGISLYGYEIFNRVGLVMKNGISINKFLKRNTDKIIELRKQYLLDETMVVLGNISRFDHNKNQSFAVEVFYSFRKICSNSILILGGTDGGMLEEVKQKVCGLGLRDSVRFIGERDDVADWLHIFDFYLFPSLCEGLGIVLLEGQAAGVSCFSTKGNVSKEVDMGLGLIEFLDLSLGASYWAKAIECKLGYEKPRKKTIEQAFRNKGFAVSDTVKMLEKIYEGESNE